jgi:Golgi phosphoprotein 3
MSEGLTRRRGAQPNPGSSSHNNHNNPRGSLSLPGNPSAGSSSTGGVEGRSKIAFDPRDYENGSMGGERERMPRLTVMEEVLLLGLKDKQVSFEFAGCESEDEVEVEVEVEVEDDERVTRRLG